MLKPHRFISTAAMVAPFFIVSACMADSSGDAVESAASTPATSGGAAAHAVLMDEQGASKGEVHVTEQADGLAVTLSATGLTPGPHGAHIHMTGVCTAPGFTSAGGHWNPTGVQHGLQNSQGAHKGDLPNLEVGADGTGTLSYVVKGATLSGGETSLLDGDGAAFVIHAGPDDMVSDPAGNAGGRVACGVFSAG